MQVCGILHLEEYRKSKIGECQMGELQYAGTVAQTALNEKRLRRGSADANRVDRCVTGQPVSGESSVRTRADDAFHHCSTGSFEMHGTPQHPKAEAHL